VVRFRLKGQSGLSGSGREVKLKEEGPQKKRPTLRRLPECDDEPDTLAKKLLAAKTR
jgi:hypothetical protein